MPYKNKEDLYVAQKRHRIKVRKSLLEYLSDKHCIDCKENDLIVLDFDHRDSKTKFKSITRMLAGHYSWKSVLAEIGKYDVRCANCHRRKMYIQFNFFGKTK
jgi:hypothetical protein